MKRHNVFCLLFVLTIFISGCSLFSNADNQSGTQPSVTEAETVSPNENTIEAPNNSVSDYSINFGNKFISLGQFGETSYFLDILGKPISEESEVLGPGADTFTGSYIKRLKYDGFDITLMSPKDDGQKYFILDVKTTNPEYKTKRGIKVGDSIKELKNSYSNISVAKDGRTDENNCAYELKDEYSVDYLRFEVKNGVIAEINLYSELP